VVIAVANPIIAAVFTVAVVVVVVVVTVSGCIAYGGIEFLEPITGLPTLVVLNELPWECFIIVTV
jgi:hypothetical protein